MTRKTIIALACAATLLAEASAARGQELESPAAHQGYYFGLGASGALDMNRHFEEGWLGVWPAVGGTFRTGQAILPWLDLGIGLAIHEAFGDEWRASLGRFGFEVQARPIGPLFVRAFAGMGFADITRTKKGAADLLGRFGGSYGLAVGADFFLFHRRSGSGGLSLAPVLWFEGGPDPTFATVITGLGFEITLWTGLPRNQLALTADKAYE